MDTPNASLGEWSRRAGPMDLAAALSELTRLCELLSVSGLVDPRRIVRGEEGFLVGPEAPAGAMSLDEIAVLPPESLEKYEIQATSLVYLVGAAGYQLLTGSRLFPQEDPVVLRQRIQSVEPTSPSFLRADIPESVEAFLYNCLEKTPEDRYGSAEEVLRALARLGQGLTVKRLRESGFSEDSEVLVLMDDGEAGTLKALESVPPPAFQSQSTTSRPGRPLHPHRAHPPRPVSLGMSAIVFLLMAAFWVALLIL